MGFNDEVYKIVKSIPRGKVVSYGQIAVMLGKPRSARVVGWAMNALSKKHPKEAAVYPWWRVLNAQGRISIVNQKVTALDQKVLLEKEGVLVTEKDGSYFVDMKKCQWVA